MASGNPYQNPYEYGGSEHYPPLPPEVTNWGMLCHLSALLGLALGGAMFLGPLIVWLLKKNDHPFIDEQGKESLNFQISMLIYGVVAAVLICVVIGFFLLIGLVVLDIIFVIIASVKVSSGENYRYPLTIRLIR
jgi:uncharacterized Tic20 family protein